MNAVRITVLFILFIIGFNFNTKAQTVAKSKMQIGAPLQAKITKNTADLAKAPTVVLTSKNSFYLQFVATEKEVEVSASQQELINKELKALEIPTITKTAKFKVLAEGDFKILAYFPDYQWRTFSESVNMQAPILFNCVLMSYSENKQVKNLLIVTGFNQ